jgi:hypothetical protein
MFIIDTSVTWELHPEFERWADEAEPCFDNAGARDYFAMQCMM